MMVVQLLDLNFPVDTVLRAMLDSNWEVTSVVETSELAGGDGSLVESACSGLLGNWLLLGLQ